MPKKSYHHGNLRTVLLQAAEVELKREGIAGLSLRGVARRAEVSHAAPAHHFGNLRGLLTALATVGFIRFSEDLELARRTADKSDALVASGQAYISFALANRELFSLMFASDLPDFSDDALGFASVQSFAEFLRDAGSAKTADGVDTQAMAAWATVHGLAVLLLTERMRSVVSLPQEARQCAILAILKHS